MEVNREFHIMSKEANSICTRRMCMAPSVFKVAQEQSYADSMEGIASHVISCSGTLIGLVVNWSITGWKIGLDFQA